MSHIITTKTKALTKFKIISLVVLWIAVESAMGQDHKIDTISPSPRSGFSMVYDQSNETVVLFGGQEASDQKLNDTWIWKHSQGWKNLYADEKSNPSPRLNASMSYNPNLKGVVLFGGLTDTGCSNELWLFKDGMWKRVDQEKKPPARQLGTMVFNPNESKLVLFGGKDDKNNRLGDTWIYADGQWKELGKEAEKPSARSSHCMIYSPNELGVLLYGGYDGNSLGDAWLLKENQWERTEDIDGPERLHSALTFDEVSKKLFLFGGFGDTGRTDDHIIYDEEWKLVDNGSTDLYPEPRAEHEMIFVPKVGLFLFDGVIGEDPRTRVRSNDTWIFNNGKWHQLK